MFSIGDKVVYPIYGAGVITDVEEKVIDGKVHSYYVLEIPIGNLKVLISEKNLNNIGIRFVMSSDELMKSINHIKKVPISMDNDWNRRYKDNMAKIKSGDIASVAEVFRNLRLREKEKGLSSTEKKVLSTAKQIILSEIILSHDIEKGQAEDVLAEAIC